MPILGPISTPPPGNTTVTQNAPIPPGTRLTGVDLVKSALRLIGVLGSGEIPTNDEAQDGLAVLNQMLDAWNSERLAIFTVSPLTFALTANKQTYTLGTGGDFNAPRPPDMDWASILYTATAGQPLEIPIKIISDAKEWREITLKNLPNTFPVCVYDDGGFPFRNLSLWPIPNATVTSLVLYVWQALTQFQDGATPLTFPPGYYEALRFNLALRLAPEYGKDASSTVVGMAIQALARVKSKNIPDLQMQCEAALVNAPGGGYVSFLSGGFASGK